MYGEVYCEDLDSFTDFEIDVPAIVYNDASMSNQNVSSEPTTYNELTKKELKQVKDDDQAIQTILLGLPKDIYAAVDSCETAQKIWLRVQQMMKGSGIGIQEKKAKRMIPEPCDQNHEVHVNETFHEQTYNELTEKELKQVKDDDQSIQTIFLGLPEDIYAAIDSCETAQKNWLRVQQMMKGSGIGIQEKKAKLFNEWEMFTSTNEESIESYYHRFTKLMNNFKRNKHFPEKIAIPKSNKPLPNNNSYNPQPSFNQNYMQQPMPNPEDITDPTTAMNMALVLMAKAIKLNYSTPTNNNKIISSNPRNRQIAQPGMNMGQDRQMQMVRGNGENQFRQYVGQNVGNQNRYNTIQNVENQNPNENGNVVAARAEGNATGNNGNHIRCYNCRGLGHLARNDTVKPMRRDDAYLQTQLLIAQKKEAFFRTYKVYNHLESHPTTESSTIDPLHRSNDSLVVTWMYLTISPKLVEMVVDVDTSAHDVWKRLKDLFHNNKDARVTQHDNELRNMSIGSSSVTNFFQDIKSKAGLANLDSLVKDTSLVTYSINGIRSKYLNVARVIRIREKAPTFDELRSMNSVR
nr:Toll/interleukin-1 receptor (TIR) domain-containing protein [Tanacetum cinerariifolium]